MLTLRNLPVSEADRNERIESIRVLFSAKAGNRTADDFGKSIFCVNVHTVSQRGLSSAGTAAVAFAVKEK